MLYYVSNAFLYATPSLTETGYASMKNNRTTGVYG